MVTIRSARTADHPRIVAAIDDWWGGRRLSVLLPALFLEHFASTSLVAETADGSLAGFLVGFRSVDVPSEAYVHFLGVAPGRRGAGLGRTLHDRFAAEQAAEGVRLVRCVTSVVNEASVAFHTAIGFRVDAVDEPVPGGDRAAALVHLSRLAAPATRFRPRPDERPADGAWPSVSWPPPDGTVLRGAWVELSVSDADADAAGLFTALDDDRVWAHVAGRPTDEAGMAALVRGKRDDPTWWPWTVRLRRPVGGFDAGDVVGTSSYLEVAPGDARLEIGSTTYAPRTWGTVVNAECKLLLLAYAFEVVGVGRVQLKTDVRNARSQQAIARLGARYEGTLRRYQRRADGSLRDTVLFSITAEEWPAVRAGLRDRLSAYGGVG